MQCVSLNPRTQDSVHCLEAMRSFIMCYADLTPHPLNLVRQTYASPNRGDTSLPRMGKAPGVHQAWTLQFYGRRERDERGGPRDAIH